MTDQHQPAHGWTVVLRRRPARMVKGRPAPAAGGSRDRDTAD